jgi:hypothetical protein
MPSSGSCRRGRAYISLAPTLRDLILQMIITSDSTATGIVGVSADAARPPRFPLRQPDC